MCQQVRVRANKCNSKTFQNNPNILTSALRLKDFQSCLFLMGKYEVVKMIKIAKSIICRNTLDLRIMTSKERGYYFSDAIFVKVRSIKQV